MSNLLPLREARLIKESSFDRVWKYLYEPKKNVQLSEQEDEILKRLQNAWNLLTGKILNDRKAVLAHRAWCKENCMNISERTAYDDIKRAKILFGDPRITSAVLDKARMSAIILDLMEEMRKLSESGTLEEKLEAAKVIEKLMNRYNKINGLEEDIKMQMPRPAITIEFSADDETLKRQTEELMKDVTDIEHEEIDD